MKKPEYSDFDITPHDLDVLKQQEDNYKAVCESVMAEHIRRGVIKARVLAVFGGLTLLGDIIYLSTADNVAGGWAVLLSCISFALFIASFIVYIARDMPTYPDRYIYVDKRIDTALKSYNSALDSYKSAVRTFNINHWKKFSWKNFRRQIGILFKESDYDVMEPKELNVNGTVCMILYKDGEFTFVQCAQRSSPVSYTDIEKFEDTVGRYTHISKHGIYVSSAGFNHWSYPKKYDVTIELWDLEDVLKLSYKVGTLIFPD